MKLANKVAIVTGGSSGIGRATAVEFAREGARVVVSDLNQDSGDEVVHQILQAEGEATFVRCDVASPEEIEALVAAAVDRYGHLDVMFNNAGMGNPPLSVLDMPLEAYHRTVSVNQHSCFYGTRAAGNAMKASGGVIINTASIYAYIAEAHDFPYHASKGAVVMMTRAAAVDLAPYNIRVVGIAPGLIDTAIVSIWKEHPEYWQKRQQASMRARAGQPEEVARVAAFLASDEASYINGQVIMVDDGVTSFNAASRL